MLKPRLSKTVKFDTWNDTTGLSIAVNAIDKAIRELPHINSSQLQTGYPVSYTHLPLPPIGSV